MMIRKNNPSVQIFPVIMSLLVLGCSGDDMRDLNSFMVEKRTRPGGVIERIPTFKPYEAFAYAATTMRSPFDRPIGARRLARLNARSAARPDLGRPREFLEQFTLDSLQMVGRLERSSGACSLIRDPYGGIHCVQLGNFLGRNHGRITDMQISHVALVEIVPDGTAEGWVERRKTLKLESP